MRFCMVTTFYPPYHFGGDAIFVQALARGLADKGHEVEVVHCEDAFRLSKNRTSMPMKDSDGVTVHRLHSRLGAISPFLTQQSGLPALKANKLRAILSRKFDVVNFHNISLVGGPGVLGLTNNPINLYTLHEHWLLCSTHIFWKNRNRACDSRQCVRCCLQSGIPPQIWRYSGLIERSLKNVDLLLSPSEYTAQRHRSAGVTRPIHVLPTFSGIDPGRSTEDLYTATPRFLYVGRVTASKGLAELLKTFSGLAQYELLIVGDGDMRAGLQKEFAGHSNIRFLPACSQNELVPLYQKATALVLPSLAPEVFPLTILEAFACSTPAIVRSAGGSREAIDKTRAGFVYETSEELYKAVIRLASDPGLRHTAGRLARRGFEQFYSRERYLKDYLDLVNEVQRRKGIAPNQEI